MWPLNRPPWYALHRRLGPLRVQHHLYDAGQHGCEPTRSERGILACAQAWAAVRQWTPKRFRPFVKRVLRYCRSCAKTIDLNKRPPFGMPRGGVLLVAVTDPKPARSFGSCGFFIGVSRIGRTRFSRADHASGSILRGASFPVRGRMHPRNR